MKKENKFLLCIVLVVVLMNLLVPLIVKQFAKGNQINPPGGVASLNMWDKFVHMCVVDGSAPIVSSLTVFLFVGLSVLIARAIC